MSDTIEIRLSGSGGQGLILAGIILAEAAILDGKNAVQTQSYGPEARGGASKAEVIISDEEIYYPKVSNPDVFLALTEEAMTKYANDVKENGLLIIDSTMKPPKDFLNVLSVPILETAQIKVGRIIVANIVALGVLTEATGAVSREAIEKAVLDRVPKGTEKINKTALQEGFQLIKLK
ncbi:2-oxoglutarate ferredoxin oxidoreductase subunit gamma [Tepidanaerobacter syntrophicus]|uniref:2-oxoacid:acceptor oxidoreductase family protein n=1 Tax=Tepidanaerobacter syntrophicus TaxID=224999 RepID=UPI001773ED25|nr:2-oxoacid:acceptor oxidoreductase family protein [Tepidanaerobacter syntrophicus]GLI19173.1 2-oxoglutarate ferredoxin oxidoreductase subunit gamma [Tepidanaerobacter syntrophicus]GLI50195.1 2-oxoglutarate ferredoxin oxidoreductase subunit gamma [Tepidanaerobacter syntrophicus]HHV83601.1 2-oxoacid:ferredoxin oxidoreductase subunit gamma [Tepidanaerobacter syntrophicus]